MTPGRMACIIVYELHSAGFLNTNTMNGPSDVVEQAIQKRIDFGDVKCIPDKDELAMERGEFGRTDGHGDGDYDE